MQHRTVAGVIGWDIMGSAMAGNLLKAGLTVAGHDADPAALRSFNDPGGSAMSGAAQVAAAARWSLQPCPA